jgi:hypothetical protein
LARKGDSYFIEFKRNVYRVKIHPKYLKTVKKQNSSALASDDMQDRIREAVQGHFYILAQAFADVDFAGIGAVTKDDFKTILTKKD